MKVAGKNDPDADDSLRAMLDQIARRVPEPVSSVSTEVRLGAPPAPPELPPAVSPGAPGGPSHWLPASASLWIWGAGQWLNGQRSLALLFFLLEILVVAVWYCLARTWQSWTWLADLFGADDLSLRAGVAVVGLAIPMLAMANIVQAYLVARRRPGARPYSGSPVIPALASAVVPGWGQLVAGRFGKAVLFLASWFLALYVLAVSHLDPRIWSRLDPTGQPIVGAFSLGAVGVLALAGLGWFLAVYDALAAIRRQRA